MGLLLGMRMTGAQGHLRLLQEAAEQLKLPHVARLLGPEEAALMGPCLSLVNVGDYIEAVLDRNLAENISRVLYPNDNVSGSWDSL